MYAYQTHKGRVIFKVFLKHSVLKVVQPIFSLISKTSNHTLYKFQRQSVALAHVLF